MAFYSNPHESFYPGAFGAGFGYGGDFGAYGAPSYSSNFASPYPSFSSGYSSYPFAPSAAPLQYSAPTYSAPSYAAPASAAAPPVYYDEPAVGYSAPTYLAPTVPAAEPVAVAPPRPSIRRTPLLVREKPKEKKKSTTVPVLGRGSIWKPWGFQAPKLMSVPQKVTYRG
eukprot:NODE_3063_length_1057_cov_58.492063_g2811_i0.p1 GENE.NODE_3063_length_1057_cov_58.492063_g2811_i0~~NODE_3063_length_1057_cov_58.492063_g2811_i0.p1  ORF type:complete len:192 (+),score=32.54 NODE_3063_length_1057_cov_58.492063_g2811_i0:72-578(+)